MTWLRNTNNLKKKMKNGKLTIHEQRMYITLLTEIGDRWIKQIENK